MDFNNVYVKYAWLDVPMHFIGGIVISYSFYLFLEEQKITIPPIKEQQLIVSEIEKQFTRLDASVKDLKSVKKKLSIYRKSVLKAAFEGKLINSQKIKKRGAS